MKLATAIQIALQLPGLRFFALLAIVVAGWQALRLVSAGFSLSKWALITAKAYTFPFWRARAWVGVLAISGLLYPCSDKIVELLDELKCRYLQPAYVHEYADIDDAHLVALYEARLKEKLDPYEFQVLTARTAETAAKINSTPLAIYETALLECGLNPFRVRDDKVAAGWIQFTRSGLNGLGVPIQQVFTACEKRDIKFIMDLTERYLTRKWENSGKPDMRATIDLYLAVFAPAHIGTSPEKVVYSGYDNPSYYKNSGLDGWYQDQGKIIRKQSACDGKITVWEIYLALKSKKAVLIREFKKG